MKLSLLIVLVLISAAPTYAYTSKKLSAIVPRASLSAEAYKDLESYARSLGKSIKNNWFPQEYNRSLRTVVKIDQGADYHEINISESSGDYSFDQSCIKSIERSTEAQKYKSAMNLEYVFEYKYQTIPLSASMISWPFKVGVGYISKLIGLSTFVTIPIL